MSSKCFFVQKEVHYLGHVVSAAGVSPDPAKIEVISSYPVPTDMKNSLAWRTITAGLCLPIQQLQILFTSY